MEEETEKIDVKKLRPLENYEEDFGEYFVNRMSPNCAQYDRDLTKDLVWNAFKILTNFDFRETIGFMTNVSDLLDEFEKKFGNRYNKTCGGCSCGKTEKKLEETPKSGGCGGCGDC